jgi:hypothetical protein
MSKQYLLAYWRGHYQSWEIWDSKEQVKARLKELYLELGVTPDDEDDFLVSELLDIREFR